MNFIYPVFNTPSHAYSGDRSVSIEYPKNKSFFDKLDFNIQPGAAVVAIRENIGYESSWSLVKVIDQRLSSAEYFNKEIYIHQNSLINIGNKQTYVPSKEQFTVIDETAPEINPNLKEIYIPYVDRKNGLYSVRIKVDYEKIIDIGLFYKVMDSAYQEGIRVLLSSRGYKSDNDSINNIINNFYTFAYINNDLDITTKRKCEPITFTISIPLNFFDNSKIDNTLDSDKNPSYFLKLTNKNFVQKMDNLAQLLLSKENEINEALFPNKIFDTFLLDFESSSFSVFIKAFTEIMTSVGAPIISNSPFLTEYKIGLDEEFNILTTEIKVYEADGYKLIKFNEGMLAQCRLTGEFSNKRIFNYLLNLDEMNKKINSMDIIEFIKTFTRFPTVNVVDENYNLNGVELNSDQIGRFRQSFLKDSTPCLGQHYSDIQKAISEGLRSTDGLIQTYIGTTSVLSSSIAVGEEDLYASWAGLDTKDSRINFKPTTIIESLRSIRGDIEREVGKIKDRDDPNRFQAGAQSIVSACSQLVWKTGIVSPLMGTASNIANEANSIQQNPLESLLYFLKRIDLEKAILKQIYCALKGADINDPLVQEFASSLKPGLINFIQFWNNASKLKGWRFWDAIISGAPLDNYIPYLCNDVFTYAAKGLIYTISVFGKVSQAKADIIAEIQQAKQIYASNPIKDPFEQIGKSMSRMIYTSIIDFTFDALKNVLDAECDDPLLDQPVDFRDPFDTHFPVDRFSVSDNNNSQIVRDNRKLSLEESFPELKESIYGYDIEYTIDLFNLLLEDIKCLLSPNETINLLRGDPSKEVIILIKNLIRNKYSKEPNNLSFLLNDDKITLLFEKLGLRVDQSYLDQMDEIIVETKNISGNDWIDVCKIVQPIPNEKFPAEFQDIKNQYRKRIENAKKAYEYLKNPNKTYTISALCPGDETEEIVNFKSDIVERYKKSIKDIFSSVLTTFTSEANSIKNRFSEEKVFLRENSPLFPSSREPYKYETFHDNLGKNINFPLYMESNKVTDAEMPTRIPQDQPDGLNEQNGIYIFRPKDRTEITTTQISDLLLSIINAGTTVSDCENDVYSSNDKFKQFLQQGRVLFENRPSKRFWDNIDKSWKQRGGQEAWESLFSKQLRKEQPELREYIISKKSVIFISREKETFYPDDKYKFEFSKQYRQGDNSGTFDWGYNWNDYNNKVNDKSVNDYVYTYRHIFYDPIKDDFRQLFYTKIKEIDDSDLDDDKINKNNIKSRIYKNLSILTGEYLFRYVFDDFSKLANVPKETTYHRIEDFYIDQYNGIKKFIKEDSSFEDWETNKYTTYVLSKNLLDIDKNNVKYNSMYDLIGGQRDNVPLFIYYENPNETLNILQDIFLKEIDNTLSKIQSYVLLMESIDAIKKHGLFNIKTEFNKPMRFVNTVTFTNSVYITVTDDIEKKTLKEQKIKELDDKFTILYPENETYYLYDDKVYDIGAEQINSFISASRGVLRLKIYNELSTYNSSSYIKLVNDVSDLSNEISFIRDGQISSGSFNDNINNSDSRIIKNPDYANKDFYAINYSAFSKLDINNDIRFQACGIFAHYLNLNYFLDKSGEEGIKKICDTNLLDVPVEILNDVLTNITLRTYVTDICVKITPLLSLFGVDQLNKLYTKQRLIDIIRRYIEFDMNMFTRSKQGYLESDQYYANFVQTKVKHSYERAKNSDSYKLNNIYLIDDVDSDTKEIDYYIRRELNHYIKFALDKKIFVPKPSGYNFIDSFMSENEVDFVGSGPIVYTGDQAQETRATFNPLVPENFIRGGVYPTNGRDVIWREYFNKNIDFFKILFENEFYLFFNYFLMACTVDYSKKSIFSGTKAELAKIYFSVSSKFGEKNNKYVDTRSKENIVKSILDIGYTADPIKTAQAYPDLMKYVMFFMENQLYSARNTLLTTAMATDPNIMVTRIFNKIMDALSTAGWSFVPQDIKNKELINAAVANNLYSFLTLKKLNSNKAPALIPYTSNDLIMSALVTASGIPVTPLGAGYLLTDAGTEIIWTLKQLKEKDDIRAAQAALTKQDPCLITEPAPIACDNIEFKKYIEEETTKYEKD